MIIVIILTIVDAWLSHRVRKETVIVAEAGKVSDMTEDYQPYVYMNPIRMQNRRQKSSILPPDYQRVIVHGHCMEPRGIMDCSQVIVKNINHDKDFSLQVKHGDILLIYLEDKDIYKLRVFDKYIEKDQLLTYRFNPKTGERIDSSIPHKRDSVIGVVEYGL